MAEDWTQELDRILDITMDLESRGFYYRTNPLFEVAGTASGTTREISRSISDVALWPNARYDGMREAWPAWRSSYRHQNLLHWMVTPQGFCVAVLYIGGMDATMNRRVIQGAAHVIREARQWTNGWMPISTTRLRAYVEDDLSPLADIARLMLL